MREILFRGKRTDNVKWNGEWVEGYVAQSGGTFIICDNGLTYGGFEMFEVAPDTVGQYTGLTDKNGVKIFEWDVVKTKKYGKNVGYSNVNDYDIFVVVYEPAMFRLVNHNRGFNCVGKRTDFEVIGNIYDNPELIGGMK